MRIAYHLLFCTSLFLLFSLKTEENAYQLALNTYKSHCVEASISYSISAPKLTKPVIKEGAIKFQHPMFVLKFPGEEIWYDGEDQYILLEESMEIIINNPRASDLFSFETKEELIDRGTMEGLSRWEVNNDSLSRTFWVDNKKHLIVQIEDRTEQGVLYSSTFSKYKLSEACPSSSFKPNLASGDKSDWSILDERE